MTNDNLKGIDFDHKAADHLRASLKQTEETASLMGGRLALLADSLETVWRHRDARKVSELMRSCASRYHDLAHDAQLVRSHLDSTESSIVIENGRRAEARMRQYGIQTEPPDLETARENERKHREELIRDSVLGPANPPWQASVH